MKVGFRNNAAGALVQAINWFDGELHLEAGDGEKFRPPENTDYLVATLGDPEGVFEIIHLAYLDYDGVGMHFSAVRGQENTSSVDWPAGAPIQALLTAGALQSLQSSDDGGGGGGGGGFVEDGNGNLLAGRDAESSSLTLGGGSPVVALMPGGNNLQRKEFIAEDWVSTGEIVYFGAYEYIALNDGNMGIDPPSMHSNNAISGAVRFSQIGRVGERRLESGSVLIGAEATPGGYESVVIGERAAGGGEYGGSVVAVGARAIAGKSEDVAVGVGAVASGGKGVALGAGALADGYCSIALGTKVQVRDAWAIRGVPVLGEGTYSSEAYAEEAAIAPEGLVALMPADIGSIRAWAPDMDVRAGDVVVPTTGGDYCYVASMPFSPETSDNMVKTGDTEPEFNGYYTFEGPLTWNHLRMSEGLKFTFLIPEHAVFYITELGFLSTEVGAVTAAPRVSLGTEDSPQLLLNQVEIPGELGAYRMHKLPIDSPKGITGTVQVTVDTPAEGGHYQGRFYLRGVFTRSRG